MRGLIRIDWYPIAALILLFSRSSLPALCQVPEISIRNYSVNEGLSQSTVTCFLQDKIGFLWIGTANGLNRFDGYNFRIFKKNRSDFSLSDNTIRGLLEDSSGNIWIGTEFGLNVYNCISGKIARVEITGFAKSEFQTICPVAFYKSNLIVWAANIGWIEINFRTNKTKVIHKDAVIGTFSWLTKRPGEIGYISGDGDLIFLNLNDKSIRKIRLHFPDGIKPEISSVDLYKENKILLSTSRGLYAADTSLNSVTEVAKNLCRKHISNCLTSNSGIRIVGDRLSGIYMFDNNWKQINFIGISQNNNDETKIPFSHITTIFMDRSGNIWMGTDGYGTCILSTHKVKFHLSNTLATSAYKLSSNFIRCLYEDTSKILWVGSFDGGLMAINRRTGKTKIYKAEPGNKFSILNNSVYSITPFGNGYLVGTESGLCHFDPLTQKFKRIYIHGYQSQSAITSSFLSSIGVYYFVSNNNMFKISDKQNLKPELIHKNLNPKTIYESGTDLILGSDKNGFRILRNNVLLFPPGMHNGMLAKTSFNSFYTDSRGVLWAATEAGMISFNKKYDIDKIFDTMNGLPDDFVYGILEDSHRNLWVSTNKGLAEFNIKNDAFKAFKMADGLQSFEFNSNAFYKNRNGEMFFGGIKGFNYFYPDSVLDNPTMPVPVLTGLNINKRKALIDTSIESKKRIVLNYDQNTLEFSFSGLEFTDPSQNQFEVRLEGLETQWYNTGESRYIQYSNLVPGIYHLWLKSCNNDGIWSSPVEMISIYIKPPFWKTWWFTLIACLTALGLCVFAIWNIFNSRLRKKLEIMQRQQEIEKIRQRISSDIHDDIGSGLTKISMISQMARNDILHHKNIDERLNRLSSSSIELSERLQEIVWAMNPRHDDLCSMTAYFRSYASDFIENTSIRLHFESPENLPTKMMNPEIRRNLFLCLKEGLNNIVKHAKACDIYITLDFQNEILKMQIIDNGTGMSTSPGLKGNGMHNMKRRMEEIQGTLEIYNREPNGTKLVFLVTIQT